MALDAPCDDFLSFASQGAPSRLLIWVHFAMKLRPGSPALGQEPRAPEKNKLRASGD